MRLRFYVSRGDDSEIKHYDNSVSSSLATGLRNFGDELEIVHNAKFDGFDPNIDVVCTWGIMGNARAIVDAYTLHNRHALMFDKSLIRHFVGSHHGTFRVGIDGPSPIKYMMRMVRPFERWEKRRIEMKPKQGPSPKRGSNLYCGSSQKYCDFYGLGDANDYAEGVMKAIRAVKLKGPMIYRPKPSFRDAREIDDTVFSGANVALKGELLKAELLVTHGSAAAVEAIIHGVPAITLGPCAAQFVAGTTIDNESVLNPYFPSDNARWQWLCNLAYCQWDVSELASGEAWGFLRNELIELDRIRL